MIPLELDEVTVTDLEVVANPADLRRDIHAFAEYVRTHEVKRAHRDNRLPQAHLQRLASLMSDPGMAAQRDEQGTCLWVEHVDDQCRGLKFVSYDTKGQYLGYSSVEPSYPDNYIKFHEKEYERFLHLPLEAQEEGILALHLESCDGGNEFFSRGALARLDRFDAWGSATGVIPTLRFPKVRQRLLELLAQCPIGVWWSTASLVEHLRLRDPWFLIPKDSPPKLTADVSLKGRYGNFIERKRGDWGNRDPIPSSDPEGFAKVEGRFVERFLEGLPLELGYVDVAYSKPKAGDTKEPSRGLLPAFCVSERLRRAVRKEIAAPKVTVLPNFEVHIESLFFPAAAEARLRPLGELVQRGIVTVVRLTKAKLAAAMAADPTLNGIDTLKALAGRPLPANVEQELNDWAGHSKKFILYDGFALLEGRREGSDTSKYVVEAISADYAVVRSAGKLFAHLEATEQVPLRIWHPEKALASPATIPTRLVPPTPASRAAVKKPIKLKRTVITTLWFPDAATHSAFLKLLLDAKCVVPADSRTLTVSYSKKAEPIVKECLSRLKADSSLVIEDVAT